MLPKLIRWVFTVALLVVVWQNSHWSVALTITFLSIETELSNFYTLV